MRFKKILLHLLGPTLSLVLSFIVGGIFILIIGKDPIEVYGRFFSETLGTSYGIGQILFKATPLMFTGLSAAIGFRSGLFNIGAEGQLYIGSFVTAWVGFTCTSLPPVVLLPLCILGGILGGAAWGAIPGLLKAKFGAHEVINTIMMNFIAAALISYLVNNIFAVPATVHTPTISDNAGLSRLEQFSDFFKGSPVNLSFFLALMACGFLYFFLWKTRQGYELRAVGLSPSAAKYGSINVAKRTIMAMTMAGGFAGLVGTNFVLGYKHYFELGFSEGVGFIGIAAALLGRNHPVGIIIASLFFGILEYGGLTINTIVPKELVNILQAIIIIFVIVTTKLSDRWIRELNKQTEPANA